MAKRFQKFIAESIKPGSPPGTGLSLAELETVAPRLNENDAIDILDELDALSAEKDAAPDWDGDTHDDIARAQETLSALLRLLSHRHRDLILQRRDGVGPAARFYLDEALKQ